MLGSSGQACVALCPGPLVAELDSIPSLLHGEGTTTVAQKGAMALGIRDTKSQGCPRPSRSRTTMATLYYLSLWRPSMKTDMLLFPESLKALKKGGQKKWVSTP